MRPLDCWHPDARASFQRTRTRSLRLSCHLIGNDQGSDHVQAKGSLQKPDLGGFIQKCIRSIQSLSTPSHPAIVTLRPTSRYLTSQGRPFTIRFGEENLHALDPP